MSSVTKVVVVGGFSREELKKNVGGVGDDSLEKVGVTRIEDLGERQGGGGEVCLSGFDYKGFNSGQI